MSRRRAIVAATPLAAAALFLLLTRTDSLFEALVGLLIRAGLWSGVLLACATLAGAACGSRLRGWRHVVWNGTAGLGALMALLLSTGQLPGGFRRETLMAGTLLLIASAAGVHAWRARRAVARSAASGASPVAPASDRAGPPLATLCILSVVAAVGLVWNRVPPMFFDTLVYHYAQPNLWLIEEIFAPKTWSLYSWFPPGMSALYGLGLAWGGNTAANDANLLLGLLLLALAADLAGRLWGRRAEWVAPLVLLSMPIVLHALGIPAADLAHGTFVFGCLAAWLLWRRDGDPVWIRRAALLAGGSVLTKALGLLVPVGLGTILFGLFGPGTRSSAGWRHLGLRALASRSLTFLLPATVMMLPWLGANLVAVGNPVAPILAPVLHVQGFAEGGHAAFYGDAMGGLPDARDIAWLGPRLLTGDPDSEGIYPTPAWGWSLLILLAVLAVWGKDDPEVRAPFLVAATALGIWFLTFRWERFLVGVTALLAVVLAGAILRAWQRGALPRLLIVLAIPVGALGAARATLSVLSFSGGLPVALGREAPQAFATRALPFAALFARMEERLDGDRHRILMLGETRHHGLDLPHEAPAVFNVHRLMASLAEDANPARANDALCEAGFTHLLVDAGWMGRSASRYPSLALLRDDPERVRRYLASLGPPLDTERGLDLFALPACAPGGSTSGRAD